MKNCLICKLLSVSKKWFLEICKCFYHGAVRLMSTVIDHYYDKKLGIETCELDFTGKNESFYKSGKYADGIRYEPTSYHLLKKIIECLKPNMNDVFIDMGCGKGRTVFIFSTYDIKKAIGVELKKELADIARKNIENLKIRNSPITIINDDVVNFDPTEGTIFFLFNPFGFKTLEKVVSNIKISLKMNPRKIRIIYYGAIHADVLDSQDWLKKEEKANIACVHIWKNI